MIHASYPGDYIASVMNNAKIKPLFAAGKSQLPIKVVLSVMACLSVFWASSFFNEETAGAQSDPGELSQTGLYSDFASRTISPRNLAYSPQYPLWSDGAQKRRWIYLPPGGTIDASDPDVWTFPIGTKIWKEFSFNGRPVETRLIERVGSTEWRFMSFAWKDDGSAAVLAPPTGLRDVAEIQPGLRHDIPSVLDCQACHVNRTTEVLGFSALQLSPDRDPSAPHAESLSSGMVTLPRLIKRRLLRSFPQTWLDHPPRIEAAGANGRPALGYLHANCGNCHNSNGTLDVINLLLRHSLAPGLLDEPALRTAVNRTGHFRIPGAGAAGRSGAPH
jgi:hypothetical protein